MKSCIAFLILALAVPGLAQTPPAAQKPLDKDQIMSLVAAGMDNEDLAKRIQDRGIDFDLSDDYLQALRKAGAQDVVIQALRTARPTPLSKEQVLKLVAAGVSGLRAATLIKQRGIGFLPDEKYLETLRVAGADEALVAAVRAAGESVTAEVTVVTSPNAEVYLDGALQGRASAQGQLAFTSKLGIHTLKVSLAGKKDFQREVTVAGGQTHKVDAPLEHIVQVQVNSKDGLKYVWIPPGAFTMGCSAGDSECFDDEKPAHRVTLNKGFWLGQSEVTVGAYKRFSRETGKAMPEEPKLSSTALNPGWGNEQMPIVNVSWDDAREYCGWAGGRLPTEAEWEYAARGGSAEARYGAVDDIAWYADNSGRSRIDSARIFKEEQTKFVDRIVANGNTMHEVGQKGPNAFNLFDMLGNVWEWTSDWYGERYYEGSPERDPTGADSGEYRVLCGGSWVGDPRFVRVSSRRGYRPVVRYISNGFSCGREVAP